MQHHIHLHSYILACVRNREDAEDILQDVAVAVTESFEQLQDQSGFLPWSREIARRRILAYYRKSKRTTLVDPEVASRLADAAERVEHDRSSDERYRALLACLDELPSDRKEMIMMRYEPSPLATIAGHFGRTVSATQALLKRLRVALHDCVSDKLSSEGCM